MKAFLMVLFSVFFAASAFAGSIAGKVVDKQTGQPLVGPMSTLKAQRLVPQPTTTVCTTSKWTMVHTRSFAIM